jgi:hypothetical protein
MAECRKELEAEVRHSYTFKEGRSLTIYLQDDKKLVAKNFEEALRQPLILNEIARAFTMEMEVGEIRCVIELNRFGGRWI